MYTLILTRARPIRVHYSDSGFGGVLAGCIQVLPVIRPLVGRYWLVPIWEGMYLRVFRPSGNLRPFGWLATPLRMGPSDPLLGCLISASRPMKCTQKHASNLVPTLDPWTPVGPLLDPSQQVLSYSMHPSVYERLLFGLAVC